MLRWSKTRSRCANYTRKIGINDGCVLDEWGFQLCCHFSFSTVRFNAANISHIWHDVSRLYRKDTGTMHWSIWTDFYILLLLSWNIVNNIDKLVSIMNIGGTSSLSESLVIRTNSYRFLCAWRALLKWVTLSHIDMQYFKTLSSCCIYISLWM